MQAMNAHPGRVDDIEIVADVVRMTRAAGPGTRARTILEHAKTMHPDVEDARIRRVCGTAANLLLAQHS